MSNKNMEGQEEATIEPEEFEDQQGHNSNSSTGSNGEETRANRLLQLIASGLSYLTKLFEKATSLVENADGLTEKQEKLVNAFIGATAKVGHNSNSTSKDERGSYSVEEARAPRELQFDEVDAGLLHLMNLVETWAPLVENADCFTEQNLVNVVAVASVKVALNCNFSSYSGNNEARVALKRRFEELKTSTSSYLNKLMKKAEEIGEKSTTCTTVEPLETKIADDIKEDKAEG